MDPRIVATLPGPSAFAFSPWFTAFLGDCIKLPFYTFGALRNTFAILLEDESAQLYPLYNVTPAYDKTWYVVQLILPRGFWRLMFAGFRSKTRGSFIAVDYIDVSKEVCPRPCKLKRVKRVYLCTTNFYLIGSANIFLIHVWPHLNNCITASYLST